MRRAQRGRGVTTCTGARATNALPTCPLKRDGTHDFRIDVPFELMVSDVTEFSISDFRCYRSSMIDCFDGDPISWWITARPGNGLCSLSRIAGRLKAGKGSISRTDGAGAAPAISGGRSAWRGASRARSRGRRRAPATLALSASSGRSSGIFPQRGLIGSHLRKERSGVELIPSVAP